MIHGSMDKWIHGSMDPWKNGSMDPWIRVPLLHETILLQEMCAPPTRNPIFSRNVCHSCTKPYFSKKCVPLLHETIFFSRNVCPSCTKPHFFKKCVPLLHETTFCSINVCPSCTKPYFSAKTPKAARADT